jgi:hypothetical protein
MHALVNLTQNAVDSELCHVITVDSDDIRERCTVVMRSGRGARYSGLIARSDVMLAPGSSE